MGTKERPEYLDEIYEILEKEVIKAVKLIDSLCYKVGGEKIQGPTYKTLRIVLVIDGNDRIRICSRANKTDSETELLLLRKRELREGGFSGPYWDRITEKVATTFEQKGLIEKRDTYSTKKQLAFEMPKETK